MGYRKRVELRLVGGGARLSTTVEAGAGHLLRRAVACLWPSTVEGAFFGVPASNEIEV